MNMDGFSLMLTVSVWDARHTESQTKRAEEHEQAQCMCALQTTTAHSVVSLTAGYKVLRPPLTPKESSKYTMNASL